jgi:hypothetical protein
MAASGDAGAAAAGATADAGNLGSGADAAGKVAVGKDAARNDGAENEPSTAKGAKEAEGEIVGTTDNASADGDAAAAEAAAPGMTGATART